MLCSETSCNSEVHCTCLNDHSCGCVGLSFTD
jgi:hypothetical protein